MKDAKSVLTRIAACHPHVESGRGFESEHFVPVCHLFNRSVAAAYQQRLEAAEIRVQRKHSRLRTEFLVPREHLQAALRLRDELIAVQPDVPPRSVARDFDACILLSPVVITLVVVVGWIPTLPPHTWLAALASGLTAMVILERLNWQYRTRIGMRWSMRDLWWATALVATNAAAWRYVSLA